MYKRERNIERRRETKRERERQREREREENKNMKLMEIGEIQFSLDMIKNCFCSMMKKKVTKNGHVRSVRLPHFPHW